MSRLDELIQEYCPNGVEYKTIGECTLKTTNIKWKQETRTFQYIDLTSVDRDTHRITETTVVNKENAPSRAQQIVQTGDILFGGTRPMLKRYCLIPEEYDGQVCSTGFCVLRPNNNIVLTNWLYHHISSSVFYNHVEMYQKGASYPAITDAEVKMFSIPVPPLPVQSEIVRILDNFTELTAELQVKLQAELTARKQQYEYYRMALLESSNETCPLLPIPDFAHTYIGLVTTMTKHFVPEGVPLIHNSSIKENRFEFKEKTYLDYEFAEKNESRRHKKGDVITVHTGDVGTSAIIQDDLDGSLGFATIVSRINDTTFVLPEWLCHCLNSKLCKNQITSMIKGDRNNLNLKDFNKLVIPVPPLEEQKRIIRILNQFDALIGDISSGIPAEIEARQKQYEYYRDKLLSFEKTGA